MLGGEYCVKAKEWHSAEHIKNTAYAKKPILFMLNLLQYKQLYIESEGCMSQAWDYEVDYWVAGTGVAGRVAYASQLGQNRA